MKERKLKSIITIKWYNFYCLIQALLISSHLRKIDLLSLSLIAPIKQHHLTSKQIFADEN